MVPEDDTGTITLINIFEIDPGDLEPFLRGWQERAQFLSEQPGFRSFRLHRALSPDSRFQLVNVAERDSPEALHAATAQDFFEESTHRSMQDFAVAAHRALYRVIMEATAE
jgi:heme-degrading monooxygenase HmoA